MELELTQGQKTIIDDADYLIVSRLSWCSFKHRDRYYAVSRTSRKVDGNRRKMIFLHRYIMGLSHGDNREVDHINNNSLDNRRCNLRICSSRQNSFNQRKNKVNTSGYKGVYWNKRYKKWEARIRLGNKKAYLGRYESKVEAAKAYDDAATLYRGSFASTNKTLGLL